MVNQNDLFEFSQNAIEKQFRQNFQQCRNNFQNQAAQKAILGNFWKILIENLFLACNAQFIFGAKDKIKFNQNLT